MTTPTIIAADDGDPISRIRDLVEDLSVAHAHWSARDPETSDGGGARRAGTWAVESIDALLRELHDLRSGTITDIRRHDDAVNARVDAMLLRRAYGGGE